MTEEHDQGRWLTLGAAATMLGVSESTVRRWADAGEVRSYRTRGGHRRIYEDDLRAMLATGSGPDNRDAWHVSDVALARVRRHLARGNDGHASHDGLFDRFDEESTERLRVLGRRLVDLFARVVEPGTSSERFADDARLMGREYGRTLVGAGVTLTEAISTFNGLRRTLDETASQIAAETGLSTEDTVIALEAVFDLCDVILEGIAEVYERRIASRAAP